MELADDEVILGLALFRDIPGSERTQILADAKRVVVSEGGVIFSEGAPAGAFFLLVSGGAKVVQVTQGGGQIVAHFVAPGQFLGLAIAVGLSKYPGTAIAMSASVILSWPAAAWAGLAARHPGFTGAAVRAVGAYLQEAFARLRQMAATRVEQRIAHALLRLLNQSGQESGTAGEIAFPVTRQDVAEIASTTLYTVSRTLHAWQEAGILGGGRRRIVVCDPLALVRIAGED